MPSASPPISAEGLFKQVAFAATGIAATSIAARHGRYVTFQVAEVAVPRSLFQKILDLIDDLRRRPAPA